MANKNKMWVCPICLDYEAALFNVDSHKRTHSIMDANIKITDWDKVLFLSLVNKRIVLTEKSR